MFGFCKTKALKKENERLTLENEYLRAVNSNLADVIRDNAKLNKEMKTLKAKLKGACASACKKKPTTKKRTAAKKKTTTRKKKR